MTNPSSNLEHILDSLDASGLRALLRSLIQEHPESAAWIDALARQQAAQNPPSHTSASPAITVDLLAIQRQVQAITRRGETAGLDIYLDQIDPLLQAGQFRDAMALLNTFTGAVMGNIDRLDVYYETHYGAYDEGENEIFSLLEYLGTLWPEVLLSASLSEEEQEEYVEKIQNWTEELEATEYLTDERYFDTALGALEYYWGDPAVQRVLQGEITELGSWDAEGAPWYADELALARLRALEHLDRFQEYLYMAQAESQLDLYVNMLARLGRTDEALAEGLKFLSEASQALMVSQTLHASGAPEEALILAEHGLTLEGQGVYPLAIWLRDMAAGTDKSELALKAAIVAVLESKSLTDYQTLRQLAGPLWSDMREDLLNRIGKRGGHYGADAIDIFLHEERVDDAILQVSDFTDRAKLVRVMAAARSSRTDWVVQAARKRADPIMDQGKANHYDDAVFWLGQARDAYLATGRDAEWQAYLDDIQATHGRKYKLMGLMREL